MAGVKWRVSTPEISTGTSALTVFKITAASNHRVYVDYIDVAYKGIVVTDAPILTRVYRLTSAGTFTSLSPVKEISGDDETLQTTMGHTATAEPTKTDLLYSGEIHPQTARRIGPFWIQGGGAIGVEVTAGVSTSVVCSSAGEE